MRLPPAAVAPALLLVSCLAAFARRPCDGRKSATCPARLVRCFAAHSAEAPPSLDHRPPKYCILEVGLEDGTALAFTDVRRFGRLSLHAEPLAEDPLNRLGFDPLVRMPDLQEFTALLRRYAHRQALKMKALLLDQASCCTAMGPA